MKVAEIMEQNVQAVSPDARVADAVTTIADSRVSGLPVVDPHGKLIGVLSTTDILNAVAENDDPRARERLFENTRVEELMSREPRTILPEADIKEAAEQMLYLDVHRLFVVDDGQLVGVITQTDVARTVATARFS